MATANPASEVQGLQGAGPADQCSSPGSQGRYAIQSGLWLTEIKPNMAFIAPRPSARERTQSMRWGVQGAGMVPAGPLASRIVQPPTGSPM